jgi:hypothetical protein
VATARGNLKKKQCSSPWVKLGSCIYAPLPVGVISMARGCRGEGV